MENKKNARSLRRVICLVLCLVLVVSILPGRVHALEMRAQVPFRIDNTDYVIEMKQFSDTLYCRADQLAQAAGCLWKYNETSQIVGFYLDTPVILASRGPGEYVLDGDTAWVPFFENAKDLGLFFSEVKDGTVIGRRATPLAVIFQEMDRIYTVERYRISELMFLMDFGWIIASVGARGYAILSSGLIEGFADALSGKMDQEMYNDIFVRMLKTDETLLDSWERERKGLKDAVRMAAFIRKGVEKDGAFPELLKKIGLNEKEIQSFADLVLREYQDGMTLDWITDAYKGVKAANLEKIIEILEMVLVVAEADAGSIAAVNAVFGDSGSDMVRNAAARAIAMRAGSAVQTTGNFTMEYVLDTIWDYYVGELEDLCKEFTTDTSLDDLKFKVAVLIMDEVLGYDDKSDAIRYSEAYSLLQLEIADYYYQHCDDDLPDNGYRMHAVTMLYLRSCYSAYKMFEFDELLEEPVKLALDTILAEIRLLGSYTEEELYQNGTGDDCVWAITDLANSLMEAAEPETEPPTEPETEPTQPPVVDNSHLYQEALDAYAQRLRDGMWLQTDADGLVAPTHYYLFDMNLDGVPEMIVFAVANYIPTFHVYTYESEPGVSWIADSLITCDLSKWYNANYTLSIYDDRYVFARAEKSTAAYTSESAALLTFDGYTAYDNYQGSYTPGNVVKLVNENGIVGGIAIGSAEDFLTGGSGHTPEQKPDSGSGAVADGTYHYALAEYPFWDGNLFYVNLARESQKPQDLHPGSYGGRLARITMEDYLSYEWYLDVYVDAVEDSVDDAYRYRMEGHTPRETFFFTIENDGCLAIYDSIGFLAEGTAIIQWFDLVQLELSADCVFRDERVGTEEYGLDMSRDEFIYMIEYTNARGTDWVEVTVTVEGGKITRMVLPYQP